MAPRLSSWNRRCAAEGTASAVGRAGGGGGAGAGGAGGGTGGSGVRPLFPLIQALWSPQGFGTAVLGGPCSQQPDAGCKVHVPQPVLPVHSLQHSAVVVTFSRWLRKAATGHEYPWMIWHPALATSVGAARATARAWNSSIVRRSRSQQPGQAGGRAASALHATLTHRPQIRDRRWEGSTYCFCAHVHEIMKKHVLLRISNNV